MMRRVSQERGRIWATGDERNMEKEYNREYGREYGRGNSRESGQRKKGKLRRRRRLIRRLTVISILAILVLLVIGLVTLIIHVVKNQISRTNNGAADRYLVILDAGHGGSDGGTVSGKAVEKEINLAVTFLLKDLLEDQNVDVILTREDDTYVELKDRAKLANRKRADLFVSLHCNYYEKSSSVQGLECYYMTGSEDDRFYADMILDSLTQSGRIPVRDTRSADFYVLRETQVPSVLVEMGYFSNETERKRLMDPEYQMKIAEDLAEAILEGLDKYGSYEEGGAS